MLEYVEQDKSSVPLSFLGRGVAVARGVGHKAGERVVLVGVLRAVRVGHRGEVAERVIAELDTAPLRVRDRGNIAREIVGKAGLVTVDAGGREAARFIGVTRLCPGGRGLGKQPPRNVVGVARLAAVRRAHVRHLAGLVIGDLRALAEGVGDLCHFAVGVVFVGGGIAQCVRFFKQMPEGVIRRIDRAAVLLQHRDHVAQFIVAHGALAAQCVSQRRDTANKTQRGEWLGSSRRGSYWGVLSEHKEQPMSQSRAQNGRVRSANGFVAIL